MPSRLPRTKTLAGPIPGCEVRDQTAASPSVSDIADAEIRTLRRFRRALPLPGLDRGQRWPTDLTRLSDRWLTVGDVTDAALVAGQWLRAHRPGCRPVVDLHALADALMALRATNDQCKKRCRELLPHPGALWIEDGRPHVVVARNWNQDGAVSVDGAGAIVAIGPWSRNWQRP